MSQIYLFPLLAAAKSLSCCVIMLVLAIIVEPVTDVSVGVGVGVDIGTDAGVGIGAGPGDISLCASAGLSSCIRILCQLLQLLPWSLLLLLLLCFNGCLGLPGIFILISHSMHQM